MKRILAALAALALTGEASAGPVAAPGSESFCQGYEETIEGVWQDASGVEVLLFRFASNPDGMGCYAWLNPVAQWDIGGAGFDEGSSFLRDGDKRAWDWGRGKHGVYVDLANGSARFVRRGRTTRGKVLDVR